jgi:predicted PurR-regulated permease PerM
MVLSAFFLSLAMEPAVNYMVNRRGWRRGSATGVVMLVVVVLGLAFVGAVASIVVQEVAHFVDQAPQYLRDVRHFLNQHFGLKLDINSLVQELKSKQGGVQDLANNLASSALDVTVTVVGLLFQIVTTFVFAYYLTADGPRFRRSICSHLPPSRQRRVLETWELSISMTGSYIYSRGLQALASAAATTLFLFLLGVPYSLALGVWVGVISQFIPTIGTYFAMFLPTLIAVIEEPIEGVYVLAFLISYQQFENYVLGPRITRRTMNVHPAIAIGTVLMGGILIGPIGAVLALPATGVVQALISASAQRYDVITTDLTTEPHRRRSGLLRWRRRRGTPHQDTDTDTPESTGD